MKNQNGYTKGPWLFARNRFNNPDHDDKVGSIVDDGEDFVLAEICGDAPNAEANARLIAAAPELLEALKEITHNYVQFVGESAFSVITARKAIAEAEGK